MPNDTLSDAPAAGPKAPAAESAPPTGQKQRIVLLVGLPASGKTQYCSLNNPDPLGEIEAASALAFTWTQIVVAHFPFHATRIDPIPARNDAFLKNLIQNGFMQGFLLLRGE